MEPYQRLEIELAAWAGYAPEQMVVCNSGTAALHLALEAFRLPIGGEVLVPDYTFIACARAVTLAGLRPVFVDCDERLCIEPDLISDKMLVRHLAVMPVHVYGRRCQMESVHSLARRAHRIYGNSLAVIEDMAESHGVQPHPETDAACYSFYRNKIISGEEGGAIAFRDPKHAAYARLLRSQGNHGDWVHTPRAMNYRMTNDAATRILQSLRMFDHNLAARREIEAEYDRLCPVEWRQPPRDVPWVYDLRIPGMEIEMRLKVLGVLRGIEIEARAGFRPCSLQDEYCVRGPVNGEYPDGAKICRNTNALDASREIIALPIQPGVTTPAQIQLAMTAIQRIVG